MADYKWKLAHSIHRYEIGGLSTAEAVGFLANFLTPDRALWYVWRPGQGDWKRAVDCAELAVAASTSAWLFAGPVASAESAPPLPAAKAPTVPPAPAPHAPASSQASPPAHAPKAHKPESQPAPAAKGTGTSDKRQHPRVDLRVKVVIVDASRTFRSYTKNISKGGFLLEKQIPWTTPGQVCNVFLMNEDTSEQIEFRAKIVSDPNNPFRVSFEDSDQRFVPILEDWLKHAQERLKKAA